MTDLRTRYEADGFVLVQEPVLSPDLVAAARAGLEAVRDGRYDTARAPYASPWTPGDDPDALCKIEMPHLASRALQAVARHPGIGAAAAAITGAERVQVWWAQLLYKPPATRPDARTRVGWHQDYQYWASDWESPDGLLTAWVALSDVTAESGPVRFVPGSHRWGDRRAGDFFETDLEAQRVGLTPPPGDEWVEVLGVLPEGGLSFHHSLTYHGSTENRTSAPRCSLVLHLCTERARPRAEGGLLAGFLGDSVATPTLHGG
ncbi:MAG: phytanoyl-CoA dioxygenase family protein [Rubricoccaceae bacterium]|nr:phytanoyl-CoA dioxygenase family protein [Rubricoccaceae bacterium]